jgi:hypothetical protein
MIMAEEPGVQGLQATEVGHLDELRVRSLLPHQATPQDQGTTVLAGAGDDRSLSLSGPLTRKAR